MLRVPDKRVTIDDVVAEVRDGMTIGIGGWGSRRKPMALVRALCRSAVKDLRVVSYGGPDVGLLCRAGKVVRTVDFEFPRGVAPAALPSPVTQAAPNFRFEEHWWRDGNHLREQTEISLRVAGRVCSPVEVEAVRTAYLALAAKINSPVRFAWRPLELPSPFASKSQSEEQMRSDEPPEE